MKISLLINMKMPTIVGIFIFISREIFMLSWVEHEKGFITWRPGFLENQVPQASARRYMQPCKVPSVIWRVSMKPRLLFSFIYVFFVSKESLYRFYVTTVTTVNPLYTDTRYDNIHYNGNLTDRNPLLKRWHLIRFYVRIMYLIIQETYDLDIC